MIRIKVDPKEALSYLESIDNDKFNKAIKENWHVDSDGYARAQSVLWLFCWAKTGMGSLDMADEVQKRF